MKNILDVAGYVFGFQAVVMYFPDIWVGKVVLSTAFLRVNNKKTNPTDMNTTAGLIGCT